MGSTKVKTCRYCGEPAHSRAGACLTVTQQVMNLLGVLLFVGIVLAAVVLLLFGATA